MNIVLLGGPGAGKGTQGARLARTFGLRHLSTGDLLRSAIASDTELGRSVRADVETGALVSDATVGGLIAQAVEDAPEGVLLDGYPRTAAQCDRLDGILGPDGCDLAIELTVSPSTILDRVRRRVVCLACGATEQAGPQPAAHTCSRCGSATAPRADDVPDVVLHRLGAYERENRPVAAWFERRGLLVQVDGNGHVDDIAEQLLSRVTSRLRLQPVG